MDLAISTGIAGVSAIVAALVFLAVDGPVDRTRVQRFADRQGLTVTADNGGQIIAYLAITRRWRAAGLAAGFTAYTLVGLTEHRIGLSIWHMLVGWFVGALIAELRVPAIRAEDPEALLVRRTPGRYLPKSSLWALTASTVVCLVVAPVPAVVIATVVCAASWWVLRRPQPVAESDAVSADDAIRSRSLHVLVASGVTLLLYAALDGFAAWMASTSTELSLMIALVGVVAVPLLGWRIATAQWTVPQPAPVSASIQAR
jgi:hypothetical protein